MSHYSNVQVILDAVVDQEYDPLEHLLFEEDVDQDEVLRSLVFVLSRLWGGTTWQFKREFRKRLTNETVEEEIDLLFWEEADDE